MHDSAALARSLREAEERLRAAGLTGAQAFDALDRALAHRGSALPDDVHPVAARLVEDLPTGPVEFLGLAYERFFADLFKGRRGQYFTPPPLVRLLASRIDVRPGQRVLDPAAGSGGLLRALGGKGVEVVGAELDPRLARLARRVLELACIPATIHHGDMFRLPLEPADIVVANPPFSVRVDDEATLARWGQATPVSSDRLFATALSSWVRPGGHAAVVLPTSLLTNRTWAPERDVLDDHFRRLAVCALPEGVFRPFGGAAGRAVLLWLQRRHAGELGLPLPMAWAELGDPGYDTRSLALKTTSTAEVDALVRGRGWSTVPAERWTPVTSSAVGPALSELATLRRERHDGEGAVVRLDLGDVDRTLGEACPVPVSGVPKGRWQISPGDLLVSRLRPELGNVVVAPRRAVGSPEWVVLGTPRYGHYLWLYLRTAAWRAQLPHSGGQTRPRVRAADVLATAVRWPGDELASEVDALAAAILARRRALREALERLADGVERFSEDGDAEALRSVVDAVTADTRPSG